MVSVLSLWLPILISAVAVFLASSVIHMVLTYHRSDYRGVPDEDGVMAALRRFSIPPGDYVIPHAESSEVLRSEEFQKKSTEGPVVMMTVLDGFAMGKSLAQWLGFCVLASVFAAYLTGQAVPAGGEAAKVFQFAGTTAFLGYALAQLQNSIWWKRAWSTTFKGLFDGLVYAMITAGIFVWLWPAS